MKSLFSFSDKGNELAKKIALTLESSQHSFSYKHKKLAVQVGEVFERAELIVFIGAIGIAVRAIAPYIKSKDKDPAVVVVDELGMFCVPILSGHLGGANDYAIKISKSIGATPVITTATDINKVFAVDNFSRDNDLLIDDISKIKHISSALLKGEKIGFKSDYEFSKLPEFIADIKENGILISNEYKQEFENTIWLRPKIYTVGVGARKNIDSEVFKKTLLSILKENNIDINLVESICSIDLKKDERAIKEFALLNKIKFITYTARELLSVKGEFSSSQFVKSVTGVDCVCERSSALRSESSEFLVRKTARDGVTVAVTKKEWRMNFELWNDWA